MRLTLRQLQIFVAVASSGTTSAAAEQVSLSQSAVSGALNELESLLEASLFDRVGKRLIINDRGRSLLPQAREMLAMAEAIEMQFLNGAPGFVERELMIGASTTIGTYLLPDLLTEYRKQCGAVLPRVTIANTSDIASAVAHFEVEIGFVEGPCHTPGLHIEPWIKDDLSIVAAPDHPLARSHVAVTVAELAEARWLLREAGSGTREAVEDALLPHLHYINEGGEFSSSEAIKRICAAGLGLACLSRSVVADLVAAGKLIELPTALPPLSRTLYMIYSARKTLTPALTEFCEFCRAWAQR